jgi:hypothetical protein
VRFQSPAKAIELGEGHVKYFANGAASAAGRYAAFVGVHEQSGRNLRARSNNGGLGHICTHAHTSTDEYSQTDGHTHSNKHTRPD